MNRLPHDIVTLMWTAFRPVTGLVGLFFFSFLFFLIVHQAVVVVGDRCISILAVFGGFRQQWWITITLGFFYIDNYLLGYSRTSCRSDTMKRYYLQWYLQQLKYFPHAFIITSFFYANISLLMKPRWRRSWLPCQRMKRMLTPSDTEQSDMNLNPKYGKKLRVSGTSAKRDRTSATNTSPTDYSSPFPRPQLGRTALCFWRKIMNHRK